MMKRRFRAAVLYPAAFLLLTGLLLAGLTGCGKKEAGKEYFHRLPGANWARFNILRFEVPAGDTKEPLDIYFFVRLNRKFSHETLGFNMVMNTASGEERIREYEIKVKSSSGAFLPEFRGDSCQAKMLLIKELNPGKPGVLKIEIENLVPYLNTEGVIGAGIRIVPSGQKP